MRGTALATLNRMAFGLRRNEPVRKGLRRILAKEVNSAIENLSRTPLTNQAVHDARKHLKKSRAVLRLVRKAVRGLSPNTEGRLRSSGRSLSGLRDASAMIGTARGLCESHGRKLTKAACELVGEDLAAHQTRLKRRHRRLVREALRGLRPISRSAARLRLKGSGEDVLKRGLKRAYTRAQREMRLACGRSGESDFHEWRKRVKALSYHLRLVSARLPAFRRRAAQMRRLEQQLGREHNLQVLRAYVARRQSRGRRPTASRLTALAEARMKQLRRSTLRAGAAAFAETPKAFVRRGFGRRSG